MADGRHTVNVVHKKRRWFESTHPHINGLFEYRLVREIFILKRGVRLSYPLQWQGPVTQLVRVPDS